ncbi:MAG: GTP-binding protein [Acetobacteraceae bacterium]
MTIPVSIVTGFLGSGKTTLISRLLRDPALAGTAVIVNEFGEIGLDHDLIASSDESLLELTTGCLCCAVQTDLARTLLDLHARRTAGTARYDRVLIETSGLAEPAPILHALMTDTALAETHALSTVVTVVDTVHGEATLAEHAAATAGRGSRLAAAE